MKKLFGILIVLVSILVLMGCGSSPAASGGGSNLPDFILNPPDNEDVIYGVGIAKMASDSMGMSISENRARVSISQQIDSRVKNMIDDYQAQAGDSENPADAEGFQQSVSRTLSQTRLSGTKVVKRDKIDGTWYALVSLSKADAAKQASDVINKEKINYAKFQNWNAQRDLEAALANEYKYNATEAAVETGGE
jgi:murein DD-endopeptidase MepM/ murein hydrolase activator NlpD